jgi:hypothetical protein
MKIYHLLKPPSLAEHPFGTAASLMMKPHYQISILLLFVAFLASACLPMATPTPAATVLAPPPTSAEKYHSLDTRTTIEEIDSILAAVNGNDKQKLTDLFSYTTIACKTIVNGLGGPPPCREGEAEATLVEVLPVLSHEGYYLYKDEISNWPGLDVAGLYAVYQVSESAYSDENFPKGNYAVILVGKENQPGVVLQINDAGIVRIDDILDDAPDALQAVLERDAERVILAPKE